MGMFDFEIRQITDFLALKMIGRVRKIVGLSIECEGLNLPVGSVCEVRRLGAAPVKAEVIGFREDTTIVMPFGEVHGVRRGDEVASVTGNQAIGVGEELLGRVVDAFGNPIDDGPPIRCSRWNPVYGGSPHPLRRKRIVEPLATGIRSIDALLTCGKGQRVGLFSGSGVGKSVLMGMIARNTNADVNVIGLIGERGREVREFIERDLGPEGMRRSVVVVATSDQPALMRMRAPFTASAIAEFFRDEGRDVMLLMDSITRMCNAQREIGLSAGEPPATKGYPPSVFDKMPKLLERAGQSENGSITGIYTVLVDADDINEPIADAARSILDGHIWLSRNIAMRGHYPAIDTLTSISRLMIEVTTKDHMRAANRMKSLIAVYRDAEDMINIGAYVKGSNPDVDAAIRMMPQINGFLKQEIDERVLYPETVRALTNLMAAVDVGVKASVPSPVAAKAREPATVSV